MIPLLFIIPRFSIQVFCLLIFFGLLLFAGIFFYFKKSVSSIKQLKNDLTGYFVFYLVILTLLFFFGPFPVRTYGVAVALGFLSAIMAARRLCLKSSINPDIIFDLAVYILIGVIVGCRLFYVVFYEWNYFINNPLKILAVWEGGLVFYGGLVGGISAGLYYVKKNNLNILKMADIIGVTIPLGLFFGRLGCLGYGCCFGNVCPQSFPFKIRFPAIGHKLIGYTPAFEKHLLNGIVTSADKFSAYVYPTQILSSLNGLVLFIILYILFQKKKFDGKIAGLTLIFYSITRFLIEFLRVEPQFIGLSVSQWIGIGIFIFGILLLKYAKKVSLK